MSTTAALQGHCTGYTYEHCLTVVTKSLHCTARHVHSETQVTTYRQLSQHLDGDYLEL